MQTDLVARLQEAGLSRQCAETLVGLGRPCLRLKPVKTPDEEIEVGATKAGGLPDLPPDFEWPHDSKGPLPFVAQFKLSDLVGFPPSESLPDSGLLSFFYSGNYWGYDPRDRQGFRVLWFPEWEELRRHSEPGAERESDVGEEAVYPSCRLEPYIAESLPSAHSDAFQALGLSDEEEEPYHEFHLEHLPEGEFQFFGVPNQIQGEMPLECQLVSNGLYCGDGTGYEDPRAEELAGGAKDWRLLLQVESSDETLMYWGDDGMVYFWIREQDLRDRRFDAAWAILQCS